VENDVKVANRSVSKRSSTVSEAVRPKVAPRVTYLIGRLERALRRRLAQTLAPLKLSVSQYTTLSVLQIGGKVSNAQLASRAFITPQAMNEVVQGLEARKLIMRRADPSHGRIVHLTLTARGTQLLQESNAAVGHLEQFMLSGLPALEQQNLRAVLAHCTQALEHCTLSRPAIEDS
jgi:DNA-binding MarR family transcriptional regulator